MTVMDFAFAVWETFYITVLSTAFALVLGLPLGGRLVAGDKDGGLPLQLLFQFGNIAVTLEILQGALGQILQALPDKGSKFLFQLEAVCLRGLLEQGRDTVRVGAVGL